MKVQHFVVGGLDVNVYEDPESHEGSRRPVAALFILHGRLGDADSVTFIAERAIRYAAEASKPNKAGKDLIVVTFDHRNHGKRLRSDLGNSGWKEKEGNHNERHAIDMYATQTGTAHDVSWLIDFLPAYVYPNGERQITEWLLAGVSLGGHSTWIALRNDPRIKIGFPIIGCPDYIKLMSDRAKRRSVEFTPPIFPEVLRTYIEKNDPATAPFKSTSQGNPFLGKQILVLSGADDKLVPWHASQEFYDGLEVGPEGAKELFLQEGKGHEVSDEMVHMLAERVWQWSLKAERYLARA